MLTRSTTTFAFAAAGFAALAIGVARADKALADLKEAHEAALQDAQANRDAAHKAARDAELIEQRERNINEWWRRK